MLKQLPHRPDCLCATCNDVPKRAQPPRRIDVDRLGRAVSEYVSSGADALEAYEPEPLKEVRIKACDKKRPPPCITCAREGGEINKHAAEFEVRDGTTGLVVSYTCDRGINGILARVLLASLVLFALACGGSSGDAGDVDGPRWDGGWIVGLVDSGEPDAGDVDAGKLEPCSSERDRRLCYAARCASSLCQLGSNLECCDGTAGQLELCTCD